MARGCGEDEAGRWRTAAERRRVGAQQRAAEIARMDAAALEKACIGDEEKAAVALEKARVEDEKIPRGRSATARAYLLIDIPCVGLRRTASGRGCEARKEASKGAALSVAAYLAHHRTAKNCRRSMPQHPATSQRRLKPSQE